MKRIYDLVRWTSGTTVAFARSIGEGLRDGWRDGHDEPVAQRERLAMCEHSIELALSHLTNETLTTIERIKRATLALTFGPHTRESERVH